MGKHKPMTSHQKNKQKANGTSLKLNLRPYPLEVIYGTAYAFLDKAYLFLELASDEEVIVSIKGKKNLNAKESRNLADEFGNELINYALRNAISKNNQKIREYIVARALGIAPNGGGQRPPAAGQQSPAAPRPNWEKDTLDAALPWEQKYKIE
jgi:His-Xaa-Ser system protein HxsD